MELVRTELRCSAHGLLLAVLALLCQTFIATAPLPRPAQAAVFAGVPLCHGGASDDTDGQQPAAPHRHDVPCALCPVCQALGSVALLPIPTSACLAPPTQVAAPVPPPPPARAPPVTTVLAATFPTGPPLPASIRA